MSLTVEARVGKKYAIYLPRVVVKALGIREGEKVLLRVSSGVLVLEVLKDPIQLALSGTKFASINPSQIEAISLEVQAKYFEDSS